METNLLRMVGDKVRGRGPVSVASYWLIGEPRALGWLKPGDKSYGSPFNIVAPGLEPSFQAAFVNRPVQGAIMVLRRKFLPAEMTKQNTLINSLVQRFVNPALGLVPFAPTAESFVNLKKRGALYLLHIKVSTV